MQKGPLSPELADAADVLSDQLREHLHRLAEALAPELDALDRKFRKLLGADTLSPKQVSGLLAITPGAAARVLAAGKPASHFIEQVEYNGRRLAKLNLPPSAVLGALERYDQILTPRLNRLKLGDTANLQWVREQLAFCIVLTLNNAYYQVREAEAKAFYDLARIELESRSLSELLRRFAESLAHTYRADSGQIFFLNDDASAWVLKAGTPSREPFAVQNRGQLDKGLSEAAFLESKNRALILDPAWGKSGQCCWSIPLKAGKETPGVLQLGFAKRHEWLPREIELLSAAAERCVRAAEKQKLVEDLCYREEQIRKLAEHMLHVEEIERQRISRELHDEAGQSLLCIRLQMEMIEQALPPNASESREQLSEARSLTERTILEMRRLISALSPAVLEQLGLGAALRQLISRFRRLYPCRVRLQVPRLRDLPQQLEIISYRLIQECLNNIGKHSAAKNVNISVTSSDGRLRLNVEDDGVGFDVASAFEKRESFGLAGMRERVALLSGKFHVESRPSKPGPVTGSRLAGTPGTRVAGTSARKAAATGTKILVELPIPS